MFKTTVVASKLREKMAEYFEMVTGDSVIQIFHRGGEVKVLMTQEHYFNLTSRLALYEKSEHHVNKVAPSSAEEIANRVRRKAQAFESEQELHDDVIIEEKRRSKVAAGSRR